MSVFVSHTPKSPASPAKSSPVLSDEPVRTPDQIQHDLELETELRQLVRNQIDDACQFWSRAMGDKVAQGRALKLIKVFACAFKVEHGRIAIVRVRKDLTHGGFKGKEAYWQGAGQGPTWAKKIQEIVQGSAIGEFDVEDVDQIADLFGAFINLWAVQLHHKHIIIACIFLSRMLWILNPRVLAVESAKVRGVSDALTSTAQHASRAHQYGAQERSRQPGLQILAARRDRIAIDEGFYHRVGRLSVVTIGPTWARRSMAVLAQNDPGHLKYMPQVALERAQLDLQVELCVPPFVALARHLRPTHDEQAVLRFVKLANVTLTKLGSTQGVEAARSALIKRQSRLDIARNLSATIRGAEPDPGQAFDERSVRSIEFSAKRVAGELKAPHAPDSDERRIWALNRVVANAQATARDPYRSRDPACPAHLDDSSPAYIAHLIEQTEGLNLAGKAKNAHGQHLNTLKTPGQREQESASASASQNAAKMEKAGFSWPSSTHELMPDTVVDALLNGGRGRIEYRRCENCGVVMAQGKGNVFNSNEINHTC